MSRMRLLSFAFVVAFALALHLVLISEKVAATGEETVRARLASASNALRGQVELLELRNSPRIEAASTELIDALKPPADPTMPVPKPDAQALRAAAAAATPEPDLLIVATSEGAAMSRRNEAAKIVDDVKTVPLAKQMLEGGVAGPLFDVVDGQLMRLQGAKIPGSVGIVVVGVAYDNHLADQLRSIVDADVTFLREGKVVASSASPERRAEIEAWLKAPNGPGFGTLELKLPLVGKALDGKLPRGASHYAVRGAQVPFDGRVMGVVTVPANPHLGWLGRYQAIYAAFFLAFLLFVVTWMLLPNKAAPKPAMVHVVPPVQVPVPVVSERVEAAASKAAASLVGANEGVDRVQKPVSRKDLPWTSSEETPKHGLPVPPEHKPTPEELWGDPLSAPKEAFTLAPPESRKPPPAPEPELIAEEDEPTLVKGPPPTPAPIPLPPPSPPPSAEERSALDLVSEGHPEPLDPPLMPLDPPLSPESGLMSPSEPTPGFSFAGLLDEAQKSKAVATPVPRPMMAQEEPDRTNPGEPSPLLLAHARGEESAEAAPWPGDEPTRIEPVSAALLDKLRERDPGEAFAASRTPAPLSEEELGLAAAQAAPQPEPEPAAEQPALTPLDPPMEPARPLSANVTLNDFSFDRPPETDPDEVHFQETFAKFLETRQQTGEAATVSYDKFAAKLRKNREDLLAKHSARAVRFAVYIKDGKAAIKASAVK